MDWCTWWWKWIKNMDVVVRKLDVLRCTVNVLGRGDLVAKTVLA
jgi:hypothetical protein